MKKYLYYISPFVIVPAMMLLFEFVDDTELIPMSPYILFGGLALVSIIIGTLTPTHRSFDYVMAIIMPLSFFCTMFVAGFFDRGCSGKPELSFDDAFDAAFQPLALIAYLVMALITFLISFKAIRIAKFIKKAKNTKSR